MPAWKVLVADLVEELRPSAEEKGVELLVEHRGPSPLEVACSPGVLMSLVSNLVGNGIKYIGDAPFKRVTILSIAVGRTVRVEVRDTGPGVPVALRDRIFDPYVRGADSSVPGMGLGLATVRRLTEAHAGTVGVEGAEGQGSLFWFELPRFPDPRPHSSGSVTSSDGDTSSVRRFLGSTTTWSRKSDVLPSPLRSPRAMTSADSPSFAARTSY